MSDPVVRIDEYTDPTCPWAWSAEPARRKLRWIYGESIEWVPRMVVLAETADQQAERGYDPETLAEKSREIAREHKMPIDTGLRDRVPGSGRACRVVVGARESGDAHGTRELLRELRRRNFSGQLIDDRAVLAEAVEAAGFDAATADGWLGDESVRQVLDEDKRAARLPSPAAKVLDHKLANWSGGRRYSCPSYEITRLTDGIRIAVPGFQPFAVYDTILANLIPGQERAELPDSAIEALEWAACPVATIEVATLTGSDFEDTREELARVADFEPVGADGFWSAA